jgi:hypothetical protein
LEEVLDALESVDDDVITSEEEDVTDSVMSVCALASPSASKRRTMKLHGKVGDRDVLILVDSGSVACFISTSLAEQL